MELVIDLGQETDISIISIGFLHYPRPWIYRPDKVEFFISTDGVNYNKVFSKNSTIDVKNDRVEKEDFVLDSAQIKARFIKVFAEGVKQNPEWHRNPGEACWMFTDEIIVE